MDFKQSGLSIRKEIDLGVDVTRLYLESCHFMQRLPEFFDIYDGYKIEVTKENLANTVEQLNLFRSDKELPKQGLREIKIVDEVEFYFHLLDKYYSFSQNKEVFNMPIKDVW